MSKPYEVCSSLSLVHSCISFFICSASLGLERSLLMNTGQPSSMEFSAADARPDNSCCMPYCSVPEVATPGIEDSSCFLKSSSVRRMGKTQLLYQGQALHCTNAWASSNISLIEKSALFQ